MKTCKKIIELPNYQFLVGVIIGVLGIIVTFFSAPTNPCKILLLMLGLFLLIIAGWLIHLFFTNFMEKKPLKRISSRKINVTSSEWINLLSTKSSTIQNTIMGVWISFIFGFISIASTEQIATILALLAFLISISFITIYLYFNRLFFYNEWLSIALENRMKNDEITAFTQGKLPDLKKGGRLYHFIPSFIILVSQCMCWMLFVVIFLFWENDFTRFIISIVMKILGDNNWIFYSIEINEILMISPIESSITLGTRHLLFTICFIISLAIYLYTRQKNIKHKKNSYLGHVRKHSNFFVLLGVIAFIILIWSILGCYYPPSSNHGSFFGFYIVGNLIIGSIIVSFANFRYQKNK